MSLTAGIQLTGAPAGSCIEELRVTLQTHGVEVLADSNATAANVVIVLFDARDDDVLDSVRRANLDQRQRLIAISTSPGKCAPGLVWALLRGGASDVWTDITDWADIARRVTDCLSRWREVDQLIVSPTVSNHLVGGSPVWQKFLRHTIEFARFSQASVLLLGESGTGKELVARMMHTLDARPTKRELVILDCTTIVPELSGSEFFGHEKGAFTGAATARDGAFALANKGTLFLDEVGELPPTLQAQLLRVIQERKYKPVGGNQWQKTSFRLICATHRDLARDVSEGRFRADLYYRIASCVLQVPALRERPGDVLPLAEHFFKEHLADETAVELQEPVRRMLLERNYPGNVRELRQLVARIAARHVGLGPITAGEVPESERPIGEGLAHSWDEELETLMRRAMCLGIGLKQIGKEASEAAIRVAIADENGNLQRAAKRLGVTDRALQIRRANQRQ